MPHDPNHDTITPTTTRHADGAAVAADIAAAHGVREIADATALTIASWWQSPGAIGSTLATLASGRPVRVGALLDDIAATRREARTAATLDTADAVALDMLATWAINHASRSTTPDAAPGTTLTAGDLIARLSRLAPDTPVIVPTDGYYANVIGVTPNGAEAYAAVIEWRDDYDSRQF